MQVWCAYDKESKEILALHIGKRNDRSFKELMKKQSHLQIDTYCTDNWKSYKKHVLKGKHIISKKKATHIERGNRDFRTHLKRLAIKPACFSKKDAMQYGIIKTYIQHRNAA